MQMNKQHPQTSFGVFKPVGHVVVSFPTARDQSAAAQELEELGFARDAIVHYTPAEMLAQTNADLARASSLAAVGQELNLIKAHRELAQNGFHWLVVHAPGDDLARRVAEIVKPFHAERAQHYGSFFIDELIDHHDVVTQVAESPDRGLDAETPSGLEAERAGRRH